VAPDATIMPVFDRQHQTAPHRHRGVHRGLAHYVSCVSVAVQARGGAEATSDSIVKPPTALSHGHEI
jgi:hypothetical protein